MENRVSITRQALLRQPMQLRKQERPRLLLRRRKHSLVQFVEPFPISGKKSAVQQRQVKLRIVFFDPLALVDGAARAAYAKSQIPHSARKFRNEGPKFYFRFFIFK